MYEDLNIFVDALDKELLDNANNNKNINMFGHVPLPFSIKLAFPLW
jgi:hypothetical protein